MSLSNKSPFNLQENDISLDSSPIPRNKQKRQIGDVEGSQIREVVNSKRLQQHKIHSEIHQYTIQMMMRSQKMLQKQEKIQKNVQEDQTTEDEKEVSTFKQKPFWPVIAKARN